MSQNRRVSGWFGSQNPLRFRGQLSQLSPTPSLSESVWDGLETSGQLSSHRSLRPESHGWYGELGSPSKCSGTPSLSRSASHTSPRGSESMSLGNACANSKADTGSL